MADTLFLSQSVGAHQPNTDDDVKVVQTMLNRHSYVTHVTLSVDGHYGPQTQRAIDRFQKLVMAMTMPDGVIPIWGLLLERLTKPDVQTQTKKKASEHKGKSHSTHIKSNPLADIPDAELETAAKALSSPNSPCEVAAIKAVASVETKGAGFDKEGRPQILFERHIFHKLTKGKWDDTHPDISDKTSGGYSAGGSQYQRLDQAEHLDETSAYESASWGAFQIMGVNHKQAGFDTVQDFVKSMQTDIHAHLKAFVTFIKNDQTLLKAIQQKQWTTFALHYNGRVGKKGHYHVRDNYDGRLADAYASISKANPAPPKAP